MFSSVTDDDGHPFLNSFCTLRLPSSYCFWKSLECYQFAYCFFAVRLLNHLKYSQTIFAQLDANFSSDPLPGSSWYILLIHHCDTRGSSTFIASKKMIMKGWLYLHKQSTPQVLFTGNNHKVTYTESAQHCQSMNICDRTGICYEKKETMHN